MILQEDLGIEEFDKKVGGIPQGTFSVIETPNHRTGIAALGHYLYEGLKMGEKCAIVTFENPVSFFDHYDRSCIDFMPFLDSGQLVFLNFNHSVSIEIGLNQNYDEVFEEILYLSGEDLQRIAINQIDALMSLHNFTLINTSAQKLVTSVDKIPQTVFGQFVQFYDQTHKDLNVACQKAASAYLVLEEDAKGTANDFLLTTKKMPWFDFDPNPINLRFNGGQGFAPRLQQVS